MIFLFLEPSFHNCTQNNAEECLKNGETVCVHKDNLIKVWQVSTIATSPSFPRWVEEHPKIWFNRHSVIIDILGEILTISWEELSNKYITCDQEGNLEIFDEEEFKNKYIKLGPKST